MEASNSTSSPSTIPVLALTDSQLPQACYVNNSHEYHKNLGFDSLTSKPNVCTNIDSTSNSGNFSQTSSSVTSCYEFIDCTNELSYGYTTQTSVNTFASTNINYPLQSSHSSKYDLNYMPSTSGRTPSPFASAASNFSYPFNSRSILHSSANPTGVSSIIPNDSYAPGLLSVHPHIPDQLVSSQTVSPVVTDSFDMQLLLSELPTSTNLAKIELEKESINVPISDDSCNLLSPKLTPPISPSTYTQLSTSQMGNAQTSGITSTFNNSNSQTHVLSGVPSVTNKINASELTQSKKEVPFINSTSYETQDSISETFKDLPKKDVFTTASVASWYFNRQLQLQDNTYKSTDTIVIVHDSCFGHRYSRPKASKSTLSLIVERPERLQACILGIACAYVRLGGFYADSLQLRLQREILGDESLNNDVPFRIEKSSRLVSLNSSFVTAVHGVKWMEELKTLCDEAEFKLGSTGKELTRSESPNGLRHAPKEKLHTGDLYLCSESLEAFQGAIGSICDAVDSIFSTPSRPARAKNAFVCVRPPGHHCSSDLPSGFCWLNNVHVGIQYAAQMYGLTHAAIIDFDLHHGDGSQSIAWAQNSKISKSSRGTPAWKKYPVGYFSLHDINSFPCEGGDLDKVRNASICIDGAHSQAIWNVHLQKWSSQEEFWQAYETRYKVVLDKAREFLVAQARRLSQITTSETAPVGAIFISAGFDASEWEDEGMQRHNVNVPTEFFARFTQEIVEMSEEKGLGVDGRVISVLEGGYSNRALISGVCSHICGLCAGEAKQKDSEDIKEKPQLRDQHHWQLSQVSISSGYGNQKLVANIEDDLTIMNNLLKNSRIGSSPKLTVEDVKLRYEISWWCRSALQAMEGLLTTINSTHIGTGGTNAVLKISPSVMIKPTFSSPTQSYAARMMVSSRGLRAASSPLRGSSETSGNCVIREDTSSSSSQSGGCCTTQANEGNGERMERESLGQINVEQAEKISKEITWIVSVNELSKIIIPTNRRITSYRADELIESRVKREARRSSAAARVSIDPTMLSKRQLRSRPGKTVVKPS